MPLSCHLPEILSLLSTVILADDLTGACDSAAAFAACGLTARVVLDFEQLARRPGQITACSVETRNLPEKTAARRLREAARISGSAQGLLFCKIDSAGRGPIGESILSLLDASGCGCALVTPAFPDQGRIVKGGVLHVVEQDGEPKSKARQVALGRLFPDGSHSMLALIAGGNATERGKQMRAALAEGRPILLCDAETQEDLFTLVEAVRQADCGPMLWCGSAGLARALAESISSSVKTVPDAAPIYKEGNICLVFAGTPHPTTARQLETLATNPAAARCVTAAVECGETTAEQVRDLWVQVQRSGGARGLILTGGDTASLVLRALRADSIL
ncbi:MAG: four-carbon acid sugar kinase family protein, partial [Acidobacteriaceae bacterium]